ncbi:hypothetical protein B9Z19DRAFT_1066349 [Tuber borchii]|uniref:HNH nuclease domain-containing protein n=1 Tax=Tuber borchii TaxID=42251 RepID=A0A2T6ZN23_TUBBO|nr:hypothetical protein B9Z19DRAFT_1066349 [Tuber borchii]
MESEGDTIKAHVLEKTSPFGKAFLRVCTQALLPAYQMELLSPPPQEPLLREQVIYIWTVRLETIRVGLVNFPTLLGAASEYDHPPLAAPASTPASSAGFSGFPAHNPMTAECPTPDPARAVDIPRPTRREIDLCLKRDQSKCLVTGKKVSDGWPIQEFWLMLELFFGVEKTDQLFAQVSANLNGLQNLVSLDSSVHAMFDKGKLALTPLNPLTNERYTFFGPYRGRYLLTVGYPYGFSNPGLITSDKIWWLPGTWPVVENTGLYVPHWDDLPGQPRTPPSGHYFALRARLVWLPAQCSQ